MKRAVLMVIDGLRADMAVPEYTPHLAAIAAGCRRFSAQRSVFPTATRVNSASIATGCYPARHGLAGNAIALDEGQGLRPVSVGPADFRDRWRRATGRTLHAPTLAERLRDHGGAVIYSNSSAGAAHMQDPDGHAWLYHRSGSFAPGLQPAQPLAASYDGAGDAIVTARFCQALLASARPLAILWICEPDHSQHALELGSPEHRAVLLGADRCARQVCDAVETLRARNDDVLFAIASDHGHETVCEIVPVRDRLSDAGFGEAVLASSGMGALLYLPDMRQRDHIAAWLRDQPWADRVYAGDELEAVGQGSDGNDNSAPAIAFGMAKQDRPNRFGVMGLGAVAADPFMPNDKVGCGQHGGLGPYESNPLLLVNGGGFTAGTTEQPSCVIDIAPTLLRHLGLPYDAMDGTPLAKH